MSFSKKEDSTFVVDIHSPHEKENHGELTVKWIKAEIFKNNKNILYELSGVDYEKSKRGL